MISPTTPLPECSRGGAHRKPFLDRLTAEGHDIVLLQRNRDLLEGGYDPGGSLQREATTFPDLDTLILEWRWPLPGRNTTPCGTPGQTCDLHRQTDLADRYTRERGTPTLIWDLDRQMPADDPLRAVPNVAVGEFALLTTPDTRRLFAGPAETPPEPTIAWMSLMAANCRTTLAPRQCHHPCCTHVRHSHAS